MKSWISFLLPDDEYKERKIMQFLSESSILLLFYLIALIAAAQIFPGWNPDMELAAGGGIGIFSFYVCGRYILSGIEYTDVTTEKRFAKEKMLILKKTFYLRLYFSRNL
ncbi:hypothetical protein [Metabacillus sp. 84]|uniref:hypothetical protein n=1 Tax=Metabacillus sp. 84 TaxID=3404705 RepID=UPI003CF73DCC